MNIEKIKIFNILSNYSLFSDSKSSPSPSSLFTIFDTFNSFISYIKSIYIPNSNPKLSLLYVKRSHDLFNKSKFSIVKPSYDKYNNIFNIIIKILEYNYDKSSHDIIYIFSKLLFLDLFLILINILRNEKIVLSLIDKINSENIFSYFPSVYKINISQTFDNFIDFCFFVPDVIHFFLLNKSDPSYDSSFTNNLELTYQNYYCKYYKLLCESIDLPKDFILILDILKSFGYFDSLSELFNIHFFKNQLFDIKSLFSILINHFYKLNDIFLLIQNIISNKFIPLPSKHLLPLSYHNNLSDSTSNINLNNSISLEINNIKYQISITNKKNFSNLSLMNYYGSCYFNTGFMLFLICIDINSLNFYPLQHFFDDLLLYDHISSVISHSKSLSFPINHHVVSNIFNRIYYSIFNQKYDVSLILLLTNFILIIYMNSFYSILNLSSNTSLDLMLFDNKNTVFNPSYLHRGLINDFLMRHYFSFTGGFENVVMLKIFNLLQLFSSHFFLSPHSLHFLHLDFEYSILIKNFSKRNSSLLFLVNNLINSLHLSSNYIIIFLNTRLKFTKNNISHLIDFPLSLPYSIIGFDIATCRHVYFAIKNFDNWITINDDINTEYLRRDKLPSNFTVEILCLKKNPINP